MSSLPPRPVSEPDASRSGRSFEAAFWPQSFQPYLSDALDQRPAGSAGKSGACKLTFAVARSGKTRLQRSFVSHPFHLTRPWYLDPALPGMAVVYIQTPAGGLIQGDRAILQFDLGDMAQVHITNQAAEKIHSMTANCALQSVSFVLGAGAYAEYSPEPVILFPRARFGQHLRVQLGRKATFFFSEIFLIRGDVTLEPFEALSTSLTVTDEAGDPLMREHGVALPLQQRLTGPGVLDRYHVWGQAVLVGRAVTEGWAREIQGEIQEDVFPDTVLVAGTTVLPGKYGVCVKVAGTQVPAVRRALRRAWQGLRLRHLGVPAPDLPK